MRTHNLAAITIAFAVVACTDATMPVATSTVGPSFSISDGVHGGNPFFKFLAPMVANPGSGTNVNGLAPVVDICEWNGSACTASLAHFTTDLSTTTTTQPGNSETVRQGSDHYIVNWHTAAFNLGFGATYRVCVSAGGLALGHADVEVVGSAKYLKSVNTNDYVGLLDDGTLPIKFRIQTGALEQAPDAGCGGGAAPGTISGKVSTDGFGASGYAVYLFAADDAGNATGLPVAYATTDGNGAYTFTSSQFVAGTSYLVCEANPWLNFLAVEETPVSSGSCDASFYYETSVYAEFGHQVIAPASNAPGVGGNDFVNFQSR